MGKRLKTRLMSIMLIITLVPLGACVNNKIVRAEVVAGDTDTQVEAQLLLDVKTAAKTRLDTYADSTNYRVAEQKTLADAISAGKTSIDAAATSDDVTIAENNAHSVIDAIKTNEDYLADELVAEKTAAKARLDAYKSASNYTEAKQKELSDAIAAGKTDIDSAKVIEDVATEERIAKEIIDGIETIDVSLSDAKTAAKSELDTYKNADDYRTEEQTKLSDAIALGKTAIDSATTVAEVTQKATSAKATIDAIKTDAQYQLEEVSTKTPDQMSAEELAAEKTFTKSELDTYKDASLYRTEQKTVLATEIAAGKTAIDSAKTRAEVKSALTSAEAKIDAIKTDAQLTADANKPAPTGDVSVLPLVAAATIGMALMVAIKKKKQLM